MVYRVFLAHSTKNANLVKAVHHALTERGIDCYVAEYRPELGKMVIEKIERALQSSDVVVFLMTKEATASNFAAQEVGFAKGASRGKELAIPFVEAGVKLVGWLHGIDPLVFNADNFEAKLGELVDYVEQLKTDKELGRAFYPEEKIPRIREKVPEVEEEVDFALLELGDISHALAKRYSADILIQGRYSRDNARKVVRTATDYVRKQNYYRNPRCESIGENKQPTLFGCSFTVPWTMLDQLTGYAVACGLTLIWNRRLNLANWAMMSNWMILSLTGTRITRRSVASIVNTRRTRLATLAVWMAFLLRQPQSSSLHETCWSPIRKTAWMKRS